MKRGQDRLFAASSVFSRQKTAAFFPFWQNKSKYVMEFFSCKKLTFSKNSII